MDPLQQAFDTWLMGLRTQGLSFAALVNARIKKGYDDAYGTWKNILFQTAPHQLQPQKPQPVTLKNFAVENYVSDVSTGLYRPFEEYLTNSTETYFTPDEPETPPPAKMVGPMILNTDPPQYGITDTRIDLPNGFPVSQDGKEYIFHRKALPFGVSKYFTDK